MSNAPVCPYYGVNDDYCDVGCGYISPHDVNMIIRYCSKRYRNCAKYQELAARFPEAQSQFSAACCMQAS